MPHSSSDPQQSQPKGHPLSIVVVGAGLIGKRHVETIQQTEGMELAGIVDPTDAAKQYAHDQKCDWYESLEAVFSGRKVDGIVIATPNKMHVEQGMECIHHRCPILVEKPIATTGAEALALVDAAKVADVPVLVGHHRRYNPLIQSAKSIIDSGRLGSVRAVHLSTWFYKPDWYFKEAPWRTAIGAGPISVNLIHDIDLARYLCGDIVKVQAQAAPSVRGSENEDVAGAVFSFESGAVGTMTISDGIVGPWSWEMTAGENPAYPKTQQNCYWIGGSRASLSIPDLIVWEQSCEPDWWQPISATASISENSDPLMGQMHHFGEVIRRRAEPVVSGEEGMKSLKVIEAVQHSAKSGETVHLS